MTHSPRSRFAALAAVTALALAVSACGSSSKGGGPSGAGSTGAPSKNINTQVGNDVNPRPRDKIADGGTLKWPEASIPEQLNFNEVDGTDGAVSDIMAAVLEQ